jgi:hypothetical protein
MTGDCTGDTGREASSGRTPREQALVDVRVALRTLHVTPAAGYSGEQQHQLLLDAAESLESLEKSLTNEVSQREGSDDV